MLRGTKTRGKSTQTSKVNQRKGHKLRGIAQVTLGFNISLCTVGTRKESGPNIG